MLEEGDFDGLADETSAAEIFGNGDEFVAVCEGSFHVRVVNDDVFVVEGVKNGLVASTTLLRCGDTTILVEDDSGTAVQTLALWIERLNEALASSSRCERRFKIKLTTGVRLPASPSRGGRVNSNIQRILTPDACAFPLSLHAVCAVRRSAK